MFFRDATEMVKFSQIYWYVSFRIIRVLSHSDLMETFAYTRGYNSGFQVTMMIIKMETKIKTPQKSWAWNKPSPPQKKTTTTTSTTKTGQAYYVSTSSGACCIRLHCLQSNAKITLTPSKSINVICINLRIFTKVFPAWNRRSVFDFLHSQPPCIHPGVLY